ncbi:MAG: 30S ribosomal protein S15 [Candidatus Aenigmatarchaeota archaeon]|nr:30S ribosomal protein S15 [Nanoarchaeota archaeon]
MARMYSRKRGKSGSKKPAKKEAPWVKYKPQEIEDIVVKLAKKGYGSAQIGLILRDQYGIPSITMINKDASIPDILKKHKLYPKFPEDLFNLLKKAAELHGHMEKNKKDYISKRGLELTESKIRRLTKYYKSKNIIDKGWKYEASKVKLLVK